MSFQIQIRDITTFPLSFWLVSIVCVSYYVAIFPFISLSQPFFKRKDGFAFDDGQASFIQSKITDMAFVQSLYVLCSNISICAYLSINFALFYRSSILHVSCLGSSFRVCYRSNWKKYSLGNVFLRRNLGSALLACHTIFPSPCIRCHGHFRSGL